MRFHFDSFPRSDQLPGLETALPEIFDRRPDHAGRIRFDDVPVLGQLTLVTACDGLGEAVNDSEKKTFDQPIQLTTEEESFVSGRVLSPDGKPAVDMRITARFSHGGRRPSSFLTSFHAVTDENGKFAIHGLPQTEFVLTIDDRKKLWTFRPSESLFVPPRQDPSLALNMEAGKQVSGRILDPQGKPVQAAGIAAVADDHGGSMLASDMTDGNGRYQFRLPSGNAYLYFNGLPDGFAYPKPQIVKQLDITPGQADIVNLDFTLQRASN